MRWLAIALVLACGANAFANGRAPSTRSITFRPSSTTDVLAGMTFGALRSSDGGATWYWTCETAVGYGGIYDPDYAFASSGAVFATTFVGLHVNRDGCTYDTTALGSAVVSEVEAAGSATVHAALSDVANASIVTSANDGVTFPTSTSPGALGDWWQSLRIAPSDAQRIYLAGYRIDNGTRSFLLFTSTNGGTSFTPMTTTNMLISQSSIVAIVGVSPTTPTTVYASVTFENATTTDGIYVSTDAGGSWTRIIGGLGPVSFLARSNGDLVAGNTAFSKVSTNGGMNWTDLPSTTPRLVCLAERSDGVVWACTQPFVTGNAIMSSSDLQTWTPRLRFADITGPTSCPAGTVQHDTCLQQWCFLRTQLSITADPTGCEPPVDGAIDGPPDAAIGADDTVVPRPPKKGCCSAGGGRESVLLSLLVMLIAVRRRPRR